jgi:hypothetical protein
MRTPFKAKFKRTIANEPNRNILDRFKKSFEESYCDHIHIFNDNKLIVENEFFFRWKPDLNWNLWIGIGKAEVSIYDNADTKRKDVEYVIDFTREAARAIASIVFLALLLQTEFTKHIYNFDILLILIIVTSFGVISYLITLVRHRSDFLRSLFASTKKQEYYNWTKILENKTIDELWDICEGKTHLPKEVSNLAKIELDKRSRVGLSK